jgi:hypothetical protein
VGGFLPQNMKNLTWSCCSAILNTFWWDEWDTHLEKWEIIQEYESVELLLSGLVACA